MKNTIVPKRYAKALIAIGREDGQAVLYGEQLSAMVDIFDTQEGFEKVLVNPLFTKNERRQALKTVLDAAGLSQVVHTFLMLLFDKGRIGFLRDIIFYYTELTDKFRGILKGQVVSATKLSAQTINKIQDVLSKKMGRNVVLSVKEDPALIGGVVTKIGDLVLDGSVRTMLSNMRETLHKGESV